MRYFNILVFLILLSAFDQSSYAQNFIFSDGKKNNKTLVVHSEAQVSTDPLIEGAKLCTRHLQRYEREYGIPVHLLSAIASVESGRYHDGLKIKLPWPWTIGVNGKKYFYNNKEEAMTAFHKLQAQGIKNIDIGCMQVNLYHHPDVFTSLSQAFEPENNVAYSASFLRNLYQEEGSWKQAASFYHTKDPKKGQEYIAKVYDSWFAIVDKLRNARINPSKNTAVKLKEVQSEEVDPVLSISQKNKKAINLLFGNFRSEDEAEFNED